MGASPSKKQRGKKDSSQATTKKLSSGKKNAFLDTSWEYEQKISWGRAVVQLCFTSTGFKMVYDRNTGSYDINSSTMILACGDWGLGPIAGKEGEYLLLKPAKIGFTGVSYSLDDGDYPDVIQEDDADKKKIFADPAEINFTDFAHKIPLQASNFVNKATTPESTEFLKIPAMTRPYHSPHADFFTSSVVPDFVVLIKAIQKARFQHNEKKQFCFYAFPTDIFKKILQIFYRLTFGPQFKGTSDQILKLYNTLAIVEQTK